MRALGKGAIFGEAVDDPAHVARLLFLEDGKRVRRRAAGVDDDRLFEARARARSCGERRAFCTSRGEWS